MADTLAISPEKKEKFYKEVITHALESSVPFLIGGTYAVMEYTGIKRPTKDLDFFCKAGDYPKLLSYMEERGYKTRIEDERFVAKIIKGDLFVDLILGSFNSSGFVDDSWFQHAPFKTFLGAKVKFLSPVDLIWSKIYIKSRGHYHGSDINHIILKQGDHIDWKSLLMRMEQHWEVLLATIINFRFVYPSERDIIPEWLIQELTERFTYQRKSPKPKKKVCRGRLFSDTEYEIDFKEWGFEDTFSIP